MAAGLSACGGFLRRTTPAHETRLLCRGRRSLPERRAIGRSSAGHRCASGAFAGEQLVGRTILQKNQVKDPVVSGFVPLAGGLAAVRAGV